MASFTQIRKRQTEKSCSNLDWEDTALIEAYDRAMSQIKGSGDKKNDQTGTGKASSNAKEHKGHRRKWKVNDFCRAIYSEDNVAYEALIMSINEDEDLCSVIFVGYENEEDVQLSSLLPSCGKSARRKQKFDSRKPHYQATESFGDDSSVYSDRTSTGSEQKRPNTHMHENPYLNYAPPTEPGFYQNPPPHPFCLPTASGSALPIGHMLPPPMPFFPSGEVTTENSLPSMLMAWYMAGYHTGIHQGLQTRQSHSHHVPADPCSYCCHDRNH